MSLLKSKNGSRVPSRLGIFALPQSMAILITHFSDCEHFLKLLLANPLNSLRIKIKGQFAKVFARASTSLHDQCWAWWPVHELLKDVEAACPGFPDRKLFVPLQPLVRHPWKQRPNDYESLITGVDEQLLQLRNKVSSALKQQYLLAGGVSRDQELS
ncbi:hypothetical protein CEXT_802561 [Caerostris extrusa]|uniref:Uncharacterized protein n=1 Tax=Caerostris extrusa TaxID=172846 RepID=A0AAV4S2G5_CAEEX|nr:hypothetical protein CEXT_802561 [Caerostris extrusa]